jgi:hypothetical protein
LVNNAFQSPANPYYDYSPSTSVLDFAEPKPGSIGIGYTYVGHKPTEMHEIAHALQRSRELPLDNELRRLKPKNPRNSDYSYFSEGSNLREPTAFANELREAMLEKGLIPDYYTPISETQVQDAYKYFKKNPSGIYDPITGNFSSDTRIFDFMAPTKENNKILTDVLNKLPAAAPIGAGIGIGASQINKKKYGGWLDSYQDGGENLPELNSKIDVANFYKNPLSNKYGIAQNPNTKAYEYYLKSDEKPVAKLKSETIKQDLKDLESQNLKKAYIPSRSQNIEEIVFPEIKQAQKRVSNFDLDLDKEFINSEIYNQNLSPVLDPKSLSIPTIENKPLVQQPKTKSVNPYSATSFWDSAELAKEILNRQKSDNINYGKFDERGDDILNRTDVGRNKDSEMFLADYAKPGSVVIDIGSALGNNDPRLAGVSVYELTQNPKLKQKNVRVIATDIPSEIQGFENLKKTKTVYPIDYAEVPLTFNTPVVDVLKKKNLENVENVYLRAANSIDLLMNTEETKEHFDYISKTLKDKNVTYLYNNVILNKPAGQTKFRKVGNLENRAFDHRRPSWKNNKSNKHYNLINTNFDKGGEINWLEKYK